MTIKTCLSCQHWQPNARGIHDCAQHVDGAPKFGDCASYVYEPGTDAEEPPRLED